MRPSQACITIIALRDLPTLRVAWYGGVATVTFASRVATPPSAGTRCVMFTICVWYGRVAAITVAPCLTIPHSAGSRCAMVMICVWRVAPPSFTVPIFNWWTSPKALISLEHLYAEFTEDAG